MRLLTIVSLEKGLTQAWATAHGFGRSISTLRQHHPYTDRPHLQLTSNRLASADPDHPSTKLTLLMCRFSVLRMSNKETIVCLTDTLEAVSRIQSIPFLHRLI